MGQLIKHPHPSKRGLGGAPGTVWRRLLPNQGFGTSDTGAVVIPVACGVSAGGATGALSNVGKL